MVRYRLKSYPRPVRFLSLFYVLGYHNFYAKRYTNRGSKGMQYGKLDRLHISRSSFPAIRYLLTFLRSLLIYLSLYSSRSRYLSLYLLTLLYTLTISRLPPIHPLSQYIRSPPTHSTSHHHVRLYDTCRGRSGRLNLYAETVERSQCHRTVGSYIYK